MKQTYQIKQDFLLRSKWFEVGSKVELLDCEAQQLMQTGHIELVINKSVNKKGA